MTRREGEPCPFSRLRDPEISRLNDDDLPHLVRMGADSRINLDDVSRYQVADLVKWRPVRSAMPRDHRVARQAWKRGVRHMAGTVLQIAELNSLNDRPSVFKTLDRGDTNDGKRSPRIGRRLDENGLKAFSQLIPVTGLISPVPGVALPFGSTVPSPGVPEGAGMYSTSVTSAVTKCSSASSFRAAWCC